MGEMEQILPPEQAARGRQRLQEEQTRDEQRRQEFRQRFEQWRQQGGDPREFFRQQREQWRQQRGQGPDGQDWPADSATPSTEADQDGQQGDRERRRAEWRRRWEERRNRGESGGEEGSEGGEGRNRWDRRRGERGEARSDNEPPPDDPLGSWERYVRDYIRRYRLDPSQQATAQSVLRDMLNQRRLFEDSRRNDVAIIQQIEDPARRQQQLDALNAPVVRMYEELKAKLESIPTLAQRQAAEGRRSTTQPAGATTQPAGNLMLPGGNATTRPAREWRNSDRREERRGRPGDDPGRWRGRSRDRD
jgi:hypothetical protein